VSREAQRPERANGRLVGTQVVTQELAGPPVGGFLFSAAAWIPFAVDAVTFAAGSALVATIRGHFGPAQEALDPAGRRTTLRVEITEGLRWLGRPPGAADDGRHGRRRQSPGRGRRRP
jgi:hypothetical protein